MKVQEKVLKIQKRVLGRWNKSLEYVPTPDKILKVIACGI
jgi:hypothetical protein